jgi:hypothetical protein
MNRSAASLGTALLLSIRLLALPPLEDLDQLPPLPIGTAAKKETFNLEPKSVSPPTGSPTFPINTPEEPFEFPQKQNPKASEQNNNTADTSQNDLKKTPAPLKDSVVGDESKATEEKDKELNFNEDTEPSVTNIDSKGTIFVYLTLLIAGITFMILWYKKQISGKIKPNKGLSVDILGQTWLDGQT